MWAGREALFLRWFEWLMRKLSTGLQKAVDTAHTATTHGTTFIPVLGRQKQADPFEFESSLVYTVVPG